MTDIHQKYMKLAAELATKSAAQGVGPFGCLVVKDGEVIAEGHNQVTGINDPTAHAEIQAIRAACKKLNSFQLTGCIIYTSCYPCPMCFGAIYWARPKAVYYDSTAAEASEIGFDDSFIYDEIELPEKDRSIPMTQLRIADYSDAFTLWKNTEEKIEY